MRQKNPEFRESGLALILGHASPDFGLVFYWTIKMWPFDCGKTRAKRDGNRYPSGGGKMLDKMDHIALGKRAGKKAGHNATFFRALSKGKMGPTARGNVAHLMNEKGPHICDIFPGE